MEDVGDARERRGQVEYMGENGCSRWRTWEESAEDEGGVNDV